MGLKITELTSPEQFDEWDTYVSQHPEGTFTQLYGWGELKKQFGWDYHILAVHEGGKIVGGSVMMDRAGLLGQKVSYVPYGPLWNSGRFDVLEVLLDGLKRESAKSVALRLEPHYQRSEIGDRRLNAGGQETAGKDLVEILKRCGFGETGKALQPEATLMLDLNKSEEELMAGMRQTTRRYIRKAEKVGLRVEVDMTGRRLEEFYLILKAVDERKKFGVHTLEYYSKAWEALGGKGEASSVQHQEVGKKLNVDLSQTLTADRLTPIQSGLTLDACEAQPYLFFVIDGEEVVGSYFLTRLGNKSWELYGGVIEAGMQKKANYLLKWEAIRAMKRDKVVYYDQWGVAPLAPLAQGQVTSDKRRVAYDESHHLAGVTYFKEGFGGRRVEYIGIWDSPRNKLVYTVARLLKKL